MKKNKREVQNIIDSYLNMNKWKVEVLLEDKKSSCENKVENDKKYVYSLENSYSIFEN